MKLAFFPLELAKPLLQKTYTREAPSPSLRRPKRVCSFTVSRHQLGACRPHPSSADRTSSRKAIPERCQGASIADHLFNQRLFWTALALEGVGQTFVSVYFRSPYVNSQVDGRYINRGRSLLTRREKCRAITLYEILSLN